MKRRRASTWPAGVTLLELAIVLAVLAVLGALAVPTLGTRLDRQRLTGAAEMLAADLADARFESARRAQTLHVEVSPGVAWCWAVTSVPGCGCGPPQACQVRTVQASAHPGIKLLEGHAVQLDPTGVAQGLTAALFESRQGERLRVDMLPLGRTRICTAAGAPLRYATC
jgi:type IV fimbrial biogenesis protein FimT